jgi:WD40 repeat protein
MARIGYGAPILMVLATLSSGAVPDESHGAWIIGITSAERGALSNPTGRALTVATPSPNFELAGAEAAAAPASPVKPGEAEPITLADHAEGVEFATFSPDGSQVLTGSDDATAMIWDAASGRLLKTLKSYVYIDHAEFSSDGARIVTQEGEDRVEVWDAASGRSLFARAGARFALSPGGDRMVIATVLKKANSNAGRVDLADVWDLQSGRRITTLRGHPADVTVEFSSDGRRIVTAGSDRIARVWDASSGRVLVTLLGHTAALDSAVFSQDSGRILTTSEDRTARVWDATSGKLVATIGPIADLSYARFLPPDDRRILTQTSTDGYGSEGPAQVWDASSGTLLTTTLKSFAADVSPDGSRIVTANGDIKARIWDAASGRLLATLEGHTGEVVDAEFSPDGSRVVTASWDGTAKIWNVEALVGKRQ